MSDWPFPRTPGDTEEARERRDEREERFRNFVPQRRK